jgi:hypothetical protein
MNQRGARSCEERNLMEVDPDVGKRWVKLAKNSKSPKMVALLSLVGFKIQHDHSLLQFSWVRSGTLSRPCRRCRHAPAHKLILQESCAVFIVVVF